jgi:hypothetical protein
MAKKSVFDLDYPEFLLRERVEPIAEGSVDYQKLLEQYQRLRNDIGENFLENDKQATSILSPVQIDSFLQYVLSSDHDFTNLGTFVSRLALNAYNFGYRRFELKGDSRLNFLFLSESFRGLEVYIEGDVGALFGSKSFKLTSKMRDVGLSCGLDSRYSKFEAKTYGRTCGMLASGSIFIGHSFGNGTGANSRRSTFIGNFFGEGVGIESQGSVYKTPNTETLQQLLDQVPKENGNKVVLIEPSGEDIREYTL